MTKRDFIELSEKTFNDIEQLVDDQYPDVDFDREGNVLTLTLEDGKVVVINRQEAMEEMWLASPLGGMHFNMTMPASSLITAKEKSPLQSA